MSNDDEATLKLTVTRLVTTHVVNLSPPVLYRYRTRERSDSQPSQETRPGGHDLQRQSQEARHAIARQRQPRSPGAKAEAAQFLAQRGSEDRKRAIKILVELIEEHPTSAKTAAEFKREILARLKGG